MARLREMAAVEETEKPEPVKFMVWFASAFDRFKGMQPHHLHAVQAHFRSIGLGEQALSESYDEGAADFGFKKA